MFIWIVMFFLIQVSDTFDDFNKKYCYNTDPSYCVLCGCYQTNETQHTLSCRDNEVIRLEPGENLMKTRPYQEQDPSSCSLNKNFCQTGFDDTEVVTTYEDRVAVYKLCTLQNTCTFTVKPVTKGNVKVVRYPYVCESKFYKDFISMFNPVSLQETGPVLYFTGKDHVGENINCGCTVTPSDQQTMEFEIFYINGDNMCNGVTFNSLDVIHCDNNNTQLYTNKIQVDDDVLNIKIKDITATRDDVLYFKVHDDRVRVTCSGCLQNTVITTLSTTTSTSISSNTVISESTNQDGSSTMTTSMSNNGDQSTTQSNQQSDMTGLGFISQAEHDEKLKANNAMFGGIIAAILIAALLGIGIYCFIRKRKKSQKSQTEKQPPVSLKSNGSEYTHYNYIDVDLPDDTDKSNQQTETKQPNTRCEPKPKAKPNAEYTEFVKNTIEIKNETTDAVSNETAPNAYFVVDPDVVDNSPNDKLVSSKTKSVPKPEDRKQVDEKSENPKEFIKHGTSLTTVKNKLKKELEDTFNQEERSQNSQILSNSDEQSDDTYMDPDVVDNSSNDKLVSSKIKSVPKPEERKQADEKSENPTEFIQHGTSLTTVKNKLKKELEDTFNQEGGSQNYHILSNSDEQSDDTYNHIGDTIEPIVTPKALSQNPINPSTEGNHNSKSLIPPVTANPHELNKDNYNHIGIGQAQKVPKSSQSNYSHIDDTLVIRDSPADIEGTYSHIEDNPQLPTPKPAPRVKNKDTKSVYLPTTEDFYENIDMELKADNSGRSTSMYDGEIEDTYNHLGNTNIVKL